MPVQTSDDTPAEYDRTPYQSVLPRIVQHEVDPVDQSVHYSTSDQHTQPVAAFPIWQSATPCALPHKRLGQPIVQTVQSVHSSLL
eukprot:scaffold6483_cov119-Skeletonema_dohrnii-CCMP3373.AAC.1